MTRYSTAGPGGSVGIKAGRDSGAEFCQRQLRGSAQAAYEV